MSSTELSERWHEGEPLPKESNVVVAFVMCSFAPLLDTGLDSMSDMTYIDSNETVRETTRMAAR